MRVGDYRVVYQVHRGALLVLVLTVGHRREVYR
jgi:mRNA interferase RelE/StbE